MTAKLNIFWRNRFDALAPSAVIAFDSSAKKLKEKLIALDDEKLGLLQGVFAENLLFVKGLAENLPWADGVIYLGKDALAPQIFLPTNRQPDVPLDLFEKKVLQIFAAQKPFVVLENKIIPIGKMLPVSRNILSEIKL